MIDVFLGGLAAILVLVAIGSGLMGVSHLRTDNVRLAAAWTDVAVKTALASYFAIVLFATFCL